MSLTSSSDCNTVQTFCALGYETASTLVETDSTFPAHEKYSYINPDLYNKIKTILLDIHSYGLLGTRNPTSDELNTISQVSQNDIIYYNNYNNILTILHKDNALITANSTIISQSLIDNLKTFIKTYQFNDDRCNYCNTGNNCAQCGTCQVNHQCSDCSDSPSENGCGCSCTGWQCYNCDSSLQGGTDCPDF